MMIMRGDEPGIDVGGKEESDGNGKASLTRNDGTARGPGSSRREKGRPKHERERKAAPRSGGKRESSSSDLPCVSTFVLIDDLPVIFRRTPSCADVVPRPTCPRPHLIARDFSLFFELAHLAYPSRSPLPIPCRVRLVLTRYGRSGGGHSVYGYTIARGPAASNQAAGSDVDAVSLPTERLYGLHWSLHECALENNRSGLVRGYAHLIIYLHLVSGDDGHVDLETSFLVDTPRKRMMALSVSTLGSRHEQSLSHALDWPSLTCQWFPDKESCVFLRSNFLPLSRTAFQPSKQALHRPQIASRHAHVRPSTILPPNRHRSHTEARSSTATTTTTSLADTLSHPNRESKSRRKSTMRGK
jgi:Histone-binding protein RBBP4 or subunit C of CAF1 complex